MPPAASPTRCPAVAARDPGLPGLAAALDPDRSAGSLDARLPWPASGRASDVRSLQAGTACVVALRLQVADRDVDVYVLLQRPGSFAKLVKHGRGPTRPASSAPAPCCSRNSPPPCTRTPTTAACGPAGARGTPCAAGACCGARWRSARISGTPSCPCSGQAGAAGRGDAADARRADRGRQGARRRLRGGQPGREAAGRRRRARGCHCGSAARTP